MDETKNPSQPDLIGLLLAVLLFLWLLVVAAAPQFIAWFSLELVVASGGDVPGWAWPLLTLGQGIFLLLPTLGAAWFWRGRSSQPVFVVWSIAAAYFLFLIPVRLAGPTAAQLTNVLQIAFSLLFLSGLILVIWRQNKAENPDWRPQLLRGHRLALALALAPIPVLGWLGYGALGSPLDTILNLIVGLLVGLIAGLMIDHFLLRPLQPYNVNPSFLLLGGGLVAGLVLFLLGAGVGHNAMQLILMITLPVLGWAVLGVAQSGKSWLGVSLLVGLNAAAPLMLVDPDELNLILNFGQRDILVWVFYAMLVHLGLGLLLSLVVLAVRLVRPRQTAEHSGQVVGWIAAALLWPGAILVYVLLGQPGFHGERLFVILQDQADVSAAANMDDYDARRQFVYDTLVAQANSSQGDIRDTLDTLSIHYTPYYLVNAIEIEAGPFLRLWLNSRPEVDRILDSPVLRPLPEQAPAATGTAFAPTTPQWNLTNIGADRVWDELAVRGAGIIIGQSDSGVQGDHPELAGRYRGRDSGDDYNWLDPWNHTLVPTDIGGHGTHTFLPAVQALRAAGIFVVVSAGNDGLAGCETVSSPLATYDEVFSVGAMDEFGRVTDFSSRGPVMVDGSGRVKPDILAPGAGILSAYPNNSYAYADGTSMAGPHIAGVVALIWSANRDLIGDIEQTEQILIETADPYSSSPANWCGSASRPNNVVGYGTVNAYAAVLRAMTGN